MSQSGAGKNTIQNVKSTTSVYAGYGGGSKSTASKPATSASDKKKAERKGEVAELQKNLELILKNPGEHARTQDVIKKVVAYMTLGIDVSPLFSEMCLLSYTKDIISKKMIYLYLNNYAEHNSGLAIMAINSFLKDCEDKDSKIKGLALRSLCSLKFDGVYDYIKPQVLKMLNDLDPYVRKTAINGCIKLNYLNPNFVDENDIINILYNYLKDSNKMVVIAAINALNEIMQEEGGMAINGKIVIHLLGRITDFDEYGQTIVLDLAAKYQPKDQDELIDIMNHLADKLKDSSPSVTLSTVKVLIKFIDYDKDLFEQVMLKVKAPLIALVSIASMEMRYVVVCHINNLIERGTAKYFSDSYKTFFCQADDPSYIQTVKMDILVKIANQETLFDILNELGEYSSDIDTYLSCLAIKTFGRLGYKFPEKVQYIIKQLSYFVKINKAHLLDDITVAFKLILTSNSNLSEAQSIFALMGDLFQHSHSEQAKMALIWILGEFGGSIELAPYLLENLVKDLAAASQDSFSVDYKLALLNAVVKLFTRRPPEMHPCLSQLFMHLMKNSAEDIDVLSRAGYYYAMLKDNLEDLKEIFDEVKYSLKYKEISDDVDPASLHFNTMEIMYRKPAEAFLKSYEHFLSVRNQEKNVKIEEDDEGIISDDPTNNHAQPVSEPKEVDQKKDTKSDKVVPTEANILDAPIVTSGPAAGQDKINEDDQALLDTLDTYFEMESDDYQIRWDKIATDSTKTARLASIKPLEVYEGMLKRRRLHTMAVGEDSTEGKIYSYGRYQNELVCLVEFTLTKATNQLTILCKADDHEFANVVVDYVSRVFI